VKQFESYTIGHSPNAVSFMARRSAESHAGFLLPHLKPGMQMLDCGCGPGTITLDLAAHIAPGAIIGIDREESQLQLARQNAVARNVTNATFQQASLYDSSFTEDQFDGVFVHALLEHLKEPVLALREIFRVLKPGGFVALRSPDWGGFLYHPGTPLFDEAVEYYQKLQIHNGGDVHAGRKLASWLLEAKFENPAKSATYECPQPITIMSDFLIQRIQESRAKNLPVDDGWATQEKAHAMIGEIRKFSSRPDAFFSIAWCEAIAWKPK